MLGRRSSPVRKEPQKDGADFLRRKRERQICERVRRLCNEAIKEIGRDVTRIETAVAVHLKFWTPREQCELYLGVLPDVLQRIMSAGSRRK